MPKRITDAIKRNDTASEVLVKIIQFAVFASWGLLYLAAPQPDPETQSQVPLVVSIYLVFTLVLLWAALRKRTDPWLIYLSIIVDMALLTYLIWSFHIQYGQHASFSLKSVEVLNYFVLISLRALRFEARYVIAAGVAAMASWLILIVIVVDGDINYPQITRSYVDYLTGNYVLIGAELSKVISMLMVTLILAVAARRAHSFLVSSVAEGSAASDLSRFVANDAVQQILDSEDMMEAGSGVRREAAILNVDIRGFTRLAASVKPQEAMTLLADYQHRIVPLVHEHGGAVDKFMGDGIMITFGAAREEPDYAARTLRCMEDILKTARSWKGPSSKLAINMAAASGPVIFGAVGDGDRLELTVIGPAVNLSAKLEKHNKVLQSKALVEKQLYELALRQGYKPTRHRRSRHKTLATRLDDTSHEMNVVVLA
ncbi:MAG: adenylate/guanylate cyclase domain-containing protein [Ahrensia sp.]|nr:adenylate/guanylate cyclase domain-containing protein [Ahrensia sp.]